MKSSCLTVLMFLSLPLIAQDFWNLDFEYGVNNGQPRKWSLEGEGTYTARLDSNIYEHGKKSLVVTVSEAQAFIFLRIPRKLVAGKSIQFAVHLKSKDEKSIQAILAFRDPAGRRPVATQPQQLTGQWNVYQHETSIPNTYTSDFLLVAVITVGTGTAWIDNVSIRINGEERGNASPDFREPTTREIEILNYQLIPLDQIEGSKLGTVFGTARVVGLGENSHGCAPVYKTKLQLLKFLVTQKGFNVFALESPSVEADVINRYVLGGSATEKDILRNLVYPSWQTREMLDIIGWIREYNSTFVKKVQFRGIDMQDGVAAIAALESLATGDAPTLSQIAALKQLYSAGISGQKSWKEAHADAIQLDIPFHSDDKSIRTTFDRYRNIIMQAMALKAKAGNRTRDDYLAENVMSLTTGNNKIIVSADNTHVTKSTGKMGRKLFDALGRDYVAVGMTFGTGTYWAYGKEKFYQVHPPYAGTYEYLFDNAAARQYILDVRRIQNIDLFNRSAGFRSIGSMPEENTQFAEISLREHFDLIVYLARSEHTVPLTNP